MTNKLPEFEGRPLIEVPIFIPRANFLESNFGQAVLKEYLGRAKYNYQNAPALNVLSYDGNVVVGSNPFAVVLVNQIVGQEGLRTATPADLEKALKTSALPLRGQYEDSALVLRTEGNPNSYLATDLMQQIITRNPKAKMPSMVPLSDLDLVYDANSPNQLRFKLKDSANIYTGLDILNRRDSKFSSKNIDPETGLPTELGEGSKILHTRRDNAGLSRLYLYWNSDLVSRNEDLADSNYGGRVVVISDKNKEDSKIIK